MYENWNTQTPAALVVCHVVHWLFISSLGLSYFTHQEVWRTEPLEASKKIFLVGIRSLSSYGQLQACSTWTSYNRAKLSLGLPDCAWCFLYPTTPKSSPFWPENISLFKGLKTQEVQTGFPLGLLDKIWRKQEEEGEVGWAGMRAKSLSSKILP